MLSSQIAGGAAALRDDGWLHRQPADPSAAPPLCQNQAQRKAGTGRQGVHRWGAQRHEGTDVERQQSRVQQQLYDGYTPVNPSGPFTAWGPLLGMSAEFMAGIVIAAEVFLSSQFVWFADEYSKHPGLLGSPGCESSRSLLCKCWRTLGEGEGTSWCNIPKSMGGELRLVLMTDR